MIQIGISKTHTNFEWKICNEKYAMKTFQRKICIFWLAFTCMNCPVKALFPRGKSKGVVTMRPNSFGSGTWIFICIFEFVVYWQPALTFRAPNMHYCIRALATKYRTPVLESSRPRCTIWSSTLAIALRSQVLKKGFNSTLCLQYK